MSILLRPAASLYGAVTNFRNYLYDQEILPTYKSTLPVVSIGNVTAGGTGKTPLTLCIAERLKERGHSPVVLSRGYGGSRCGPWLVDLQKDTAATVGDEPLLLTRRLGVPVVISRERAAGARLIEERKLG